MRLLLPSLEQTIAVGEGVPQGARLLLWLVIGLFLLMLTSLLTMVAMMRHRHLNKQCQVNRHAESTDDKSKESLGHEAFEDKALLDFANHNVIHGDMLCLLCNGAFNADQMYCPSDGCRLVLRSEIESCDGRVCPICSRGFTESLCFCPHDGAALVVADPQRAMRLATAPGDCTSKICPRCRTLHEYHHMFCSNDGSELRVLN